jgi:uncharacterized protein YndB with AHSA1/START domain
MRLRNEAMPWVERETVIEASPDEVWEALTDDDRLEEWMAPEVELDPVEGGEISIRDDDGERSGTVETVEESERLAFTWSRPGEEETFVELTIEAVPDGTRVVVVETPIGPGASAGIRPVALALPVSAGWADRLSRLRERLALLPVA